MTNLGVKHLISHQIKFKMWDDVIGNKHGILINMKITL